MTHKTELPPSLNPADAISTKEGREIYRLQKQLTQCQKDKAKFDKFLSPRFWTKEMHDAWHRNLPDTQAAFDELKALINKHKE